MAIFNMLIFLVMAVVLVIVAIPLFILRRLRGGGGTKKDGDGQGWKRGWVNPRKREGDVTVSGTKPSKEEKIVGDNIGEYVEYEEVDNSDNKEKR